MKVYKIAKITIIVSCMSLRHVINKKNSNNKYVAKIKLIYKNLKKNF